MINDTVVSLEAYMRSTLFQRSPKIYVKGNKGDILKLACLNICHWIEVMTNNDMIAFYNTIMIKCHKTLFHWHNSKSQYLRVTLKRANQNRFSLETGIIYDTYM